MGLRQMLVVKLILTHSFKLK